MVPDAVFVLGCDKPLFVLKCTDIPDETSYSINLFF